jgi:hypothetical protein
MLPAAQEGDTIYVHEETNARECDGDKRLTKKFMRIQPFIHIGSCLNGHKTILCFNREVIV